MLAHSQGTAVGRLAQGVVIFVGLLVALSVALPTFKPGDVVQVLGISSVALDPRDQVLTAIRAALSTHGIDLPFPTQQILFHDQTEESDGNRTRQREGWPAKTGGVGSARH